MWFRKFRYRDPHEKNWENPIPLWFPRGFRMVSPWFSYDLSRPRQGKVSGGRPGPGAPGTPRGGGGTSVELRMGMSRTMEVYMNKFIYSHMSIHIMHLYIYICISYIYIYTYICKNVIYRFMFWILSFEM